MQIRELTFHLDRLRDDTELLQKALLFLGGALFLAYFLPWGFPGLGARWEMDLFVDIWPFLWAFGFGAIGAAKLLRLPFRPRPFGMGVALLGFGAIGLMVVSLKLAGDGPGFVNALVLGTLPFLVTGAMGHLGLFTILGALFLQGRHPDWKPARYLAFAGAGLLVLGLLVPGKTTGDTFPLTALFRQASGLEILLSLYALLTIAATIALALLPLGPKDLLPPAVTAFGPLLILALLPPAWLLYWILGQSGSWQDLYSIPHRVLTLGGLLGALLVGADLVVAALRSELPNRFVPWDLGPGAAAQPETPSAPNSQQPYGGQQQPYGGQQQPYGGQQQQGDVTPVEQAGSPCPMCGEGMEWVAQYERWYCHRCSQYL
ncbi:MAG: hypothetical protein RBU30_00980 [Polyangia bacterium]|jgi:ribosomal protein S27AE|nr:hypothetical protein [Polyangia bacterium]